MLFCIEERARDDGIREHGHPHHTALRRRQYTYKIMARSRNYFCRGKAVSIKYYECLYVVLAIQHVNHKYFASYHVSCDLSGSNIFFSHYIINGTVFGGGEENC